MPATCTCWTPNLTRSGSYVGKDGTFVDRPYFFFGGQIPELDDAIDLAVNGDDLYILHSDGHLSTCSYSRIETVPTRCVDPAPLVNPLPAYRDLDLFSEAHFTQMMFTPAPDSALLLLDSDSQGVFRFAPRSLELQSQLRPLAGRDNPLATRRCGRHDSQPQSRIVFCAAGQDLLSRPIRLRVFGAALDSTDWRSHGASSGCYIMEEPCHFQIS